MGNGNRMNLSFAGCGFLGIYHVGVASCFKEYAPHLIADRIAGASAGALVATALFTGCCLGHCTSYTLRIAGKARSRALGPLHPSFDICKILRDGLESILPENAHEIVSGRVFISLTRVADRKNVVVSQFDSREDLIQALMCSAFIPFYSGIIPPSYKGVRYVDGGLSNNIPILDEHTVTVSPFAGESDICPNDNISTDWHLNLANSSIQLSMSNLYRMSHIMFPPHPEVLSKMCKQGFDDALKFLQRHNLISCARHLSIQSSITSKSPIKERDLIYPEEDVPSEDEEDNKHLQLVTQHTHHHSPHDHCEDCKQQQHSALLDSLPLPVVSALQAACDSVNKGLLNSVYNLRAFKVMSLMTAPWILPLDVTVVLVKKFIYWAPQMPKDMQWFTKQFLQIIRALVQYIRHGEHRYSARFTCQLAITEVDYGRRNVDPPVGTPKRPRKVKSKDSRAPSSRRCNLNVGFSVDFDSRYHAPLRCMDELRHHILDDENGHVDIQELPPNTELPELEGQGELVSAQHTEECHVEYDTFENCLHIANQMESIIAFYYMEEDNPNMVRITEIFGLNEAQTPKSEVGEMIWDNYMEVKPEPGDEILDLIYSDSETSSATPVDASTSNNDCVAVTMPEPPTSQSA